MSKKNLIYVFADQWRAHAAGFSKSDPVLTPNMDAFAEKSMKFTNAISTYPLCSPHRASLLTGKYPTSCGMWTNCKPGLYETVMLKPQEICISDVLHENGYYTGYIGKWHLDSSELNFYKNPKSGAGEWDAYTPPGERRHSFDKWLSYGAMDKHMDPHYWEDTEEKIKPKKYSPEFETDRALCFMEEAPKDKPFLLFLSWNPPHSPYDELPQRAIDRYKAFIPSFRDNVPQSMREDEQFLLNMRNYFAAVTELDFQFGRLLDYLTKNNMWEDTILVLSSDHGDMMGSHGLYAKNVWYEESIKIPLVIGGAGIKEGSCDGLIASQDHMPTLLELLHTPIPDTVEGISYADCVLGKENKSLPEHAFICMTPGMDEMVKSFTSRGLFNRSYGWRGIRTKTHTYVVDNGVAPGVTPQRLLYDNINDPFQLNPVTLEKSSHMAIEYERILKQYLEKLNDSFLL